MDNEGIELSENMDFTWALMILPFVSAGVGAYLGSYLKKKGENLATHEDIEIVLDQVRKVTQTTKEIEAKISNEVWDRQKQWELKREVILAVAKGISQIDEALVGIEATLQVEQKPNDPVFAEAVLEKLVAWREASGTFDEARLLSSVVCSPETIEAVNALGMFTFKLAEQMSKNRDATIYRKSGGELAAKLFGAKTAIRKELGFAAVSNPQSNVSSATPNAGSRGSE